MIPPTLKPTRITNTSATISENILTNCDKEITTTILDTDITNHFPIIFVKRTKHVKPKIKSDKKQNKKAFVYSRK